MDMVGIIFSNIYDSTLGDLTKNRTVASVPFGGRYRQIDFVLSNMVNSNITTVGVITKHHYQSLMDHLISRSEWDLNRKNGGLFILPPFLSGQTEVYRGKIEALYGALSFLRHCSSDYVVLSDAVTVCNIDYEEALESHIKSGADVTVIANKEENSGSKERRLLLKTKGNKVTDIAIDCASDKYDLTGMGMFIIERNLLMEMVKNCVAHGKYHFERDFLQESFTNKDISVNAYEFKSVVLRNDSVVSYFKNNFKLMDESVRKAIFASDAPIYTKVRDEVPTFYGENAVVDDCIIADGCTIKGHVENCVIFRNVTIEEDCYIKNSIIMQGGIIEKGCNIDCVIADKDVKINKGRTLIGAETAPLIINKAEVV